MSTDLSIELEESAWQPVRCYLHDALADAARNAGGQVGWVFDDERVTFAGLQLGAESLAAKLATLGAASGDTVAIWLPNELTWAEALFACSIVGARLAAINTRSKIDEVAHILANSRAKVLIFRAGFLNVDCSAILRNVLPGVALPDYSKTDSQIYVLPLAGVRVRTAVPLSDVAASPVPPVQRHAPDREALLIQYTSGSMALPKGALLSHVHVLNFGHWTVARMGVRRGDAVLNTQPFYHIGGSIGCLPVPLTLGCVAVIPEFYEPSKVLELIERERCVARTGMSTMYVREMQLPDFHDYDVSSLRAGWTIGPPALLDRIRADFPIEGMVQLYGSSEGGATTGDIAEPWDVRRVSAGRPIPGTHFSIVDPETGASVPPGQTGEIRFSGWACCLGYVGVETDMAFDSAGRFSTGDLGHFDQEGRLYFDGRLKEMIKPGGENVSALEVEAFLGQHPEIAQVAVFGVPDDDLGEAVVAVIERVAGSALGQEDIVAYSRGRVAAFRIPRHFRFVTEWPMTGSGKILKRLLRETYLAELQANPQKVLT